MIFYQTEGWLLCTITFFFPGAGDGCMHILTLSISLTNPYLGMLSQNVG